MRASCCRIRRSVSARTSTRCTSLACPVSALLWYVGTSLAVPSVKMVVDCVLMIRPAKITRVSRKTPSSSPSCLREHQYVSRTTTNDRERIRRRLREIVRERNSALSLSHRARITVQRPSCLGGEQGHIRARLGDVHASDERTACDTRDISGRSSER
ncbi:hypothetical protein C8Q80DRAFT_436394 [Daedaleopsis nitida]|nr:hypothetical protein C8Q80DRAFT_436394 [Daedaleopsis nitida]